MRNCQECRKCCEGWLHAKVFNNVLSPNNPCPLLNIDLNQLGCSIHNDRPIKPCRIFNCLWILDDMPESFKPNKSGVIFTRTKLDNFLYIFIINAPNYASEEIINWSIENYVKNGQNLIYFDKADNLIIYGSDEFCKSMKQNENNIKIEYNKLKEYYIK